MKKLGINLIDKILTMNIIIKRLNYIINPMCMSMSIITTKMDTEMVYVLDRSRQDIIID